MTEHKHLKRLARVWITDPVFFITTCSHQRQTILANTQIAKILVDEWAGARERHGWMVGRYVIMPDHVHFFCAPIRGIAPLDGINDPIYKDLSGFIQQWKQWTSKRIIRECNSPNGPSGLRQQFVSPIWQAEFFDHLLRSQESYSQKWEYVHQNPVRKGLVKRVDDWQWQGEIYDLKMSSR